MDDRIKIYPDQAVQPQQRCLTLGDQLEVVAVHKTGVSFAAIGHKFEIADLVIQTTISRSPSLTRSETKYSTRDHPSLVDKLRILHLLDSGASVNKV